MENREKLIGSTKAARELGISTCTLRKWARENKIPHTRINTRYLFLEEKIKEFKTSDFYRKRKPKYTLIYIVVDNKNELEQIIKKVKKYSQSKKWKELIITDIKTNNRSYESKGMREAFDCFYQRRIERFVYNSNYLNTEILKTLIKDQNIEVQNIDSVLQELKNK